MWKVSNWSNCSPYKLLNSPTFTEIYFGSCDGAGPTQHTRVFSSAPSSGLVCPLCSSLSLYFTMWKLLTILTFHITHLILTEYKNKYKFCILLYHVKGWIRETNVTLWAKVQICCNPTATVALITIELPYYSSCAAMVRFYSQQKPPWLQYCIKNRHGLPQIQSLSLLFLLTDRPPRSWLLTDMQTTV